MSIRKAGAVLFWALSLISVLGLVGLGWFIRDGLGPDAVESHGLKAVERIWESGAGWGLVCLASPLAVVGFLVYPAQRKRGVIIFFCTYLGAIILMLISGMIFADRNFSQNNSMSEDAVFGMTLEHIVAQVSLCIGGVVGGTTGWRLTRIR